jgi:hypothetical protein
MADIRRVPWSSKAESQDGQWFAFSPAKKLFPLNTNGLQYSDSCLHVVEIGQHHLGLLHKFILDRAVVGSSFENDLMFRG